MDFAVKVKVVQSDDGLTLKIVDDSNYSDNTEGITKPDILTRSLVIKNAAGDTIDTVAMDLIDDDGNYYAEHAITADVYRSLLPTFTIVGFEPRSGTDNFLSKRFYKNKYVAYMATVCPGDCGCNKPTKCNELVWAERYCNAAIELASRYEALAAQEDITAANSLIDQLQTCNC